MMSATLLVLVTCLSVCLPLSTTSLPGLKIRMTQKGLDYANSVALTAISKELKDLQIGDQAGSKSSIEWSVTRIENRGLTLPSSSMSFDPSSNGLSWTVSGLGIDLHSHYWRVKFKKGWFKLSSSGSVDLNVKSASVQVTVSLGQSDGRPSVSMSQCQARISKVDVYFHGGQAIILNLFRGTIGGHIKDLMVGEICKVARKLVNEDLNDELAQLKVQEEIDKKFLLDYSLVSPPKVQATALDLENKGEIYWKADVQEAPFSPKPIPDLNAESHMMYVWVTDFAARTAIHNAYIHDYLQYNITENDFPSGKESFMDTSCNLFCIGTILPVLGMILPNAKMQASVRALDQPLLSIHPEGINLGGTAMIGFHAVTAEEKIHDVIKIELELFLSVTGSVLYERLAGEIIEHRINIKSIESHIGDINPDDMNLMLKAALDLGVIPGLNAIMKQGVDLPVTEVLSFKDTQLTLLDGSILIGTDVMAFREAPPQQEIQRQLQEEKKRQQEQLLQQQQDLQLKRQQERQAKLEVQSKKPEETQQPELKQTTEQYVLTTQPQILPTYETGNSPSPVPIDITKPGRISEEPKSTEKLSTTGNLGDIKPSIANKQLSTTEEPQQKQLPTKQEHNAYCNSVKNFCESSMKYCN